MCYFFFSSRRRHTILQGDWSSDVCSSDLHVRKQRHARLGGDRERAELAGGDVRQHGRRIVDQIGRASCRERVEITGGAVRGKERKVGKRKKEWKRCRM